MSRRVLAVAAACLALGLGATACNEGEPAPGPAATESPGTGQPEVCAAMDDLRASVEDLASVPVDRNGLSALSAQLSEIREDLRRVRTSASGEYAPEVAALDSALDALQTSLQEATADPSSTTLGRVLQEVGSVGAAMRELGTAVGETC